MTETLLLALAAAIVAVLYSSVGHGGASGYLAVMGLMAVPRDTASTSALVLNLLVAGTAWISFNRAGHFSWKLVGPFLLGSLPLAFIGGSLKLANPVFDGLLGFSLAAAAVSMALPRPAAADTIPDRPPRIEGAITIGCSLGLLSGMVGVGGGIFLSPLMIVFRWASPARVAATSAAFIVVNSAAGLGGRLYSGQFGMAGLLPVAIAAFGGGLLGSWLGARKLTPPWLRRVLAVVLVVAAGKMLLRAAGL